MITRRRLPCLLGSLAALGCRPSSSLVDASTQLRTGALVDSLREAEDRVRAQVEARLANEDVRWDWQSFDGDPAHLTEMDALVAYLQMLGTLVDVNSAAAQEDLATEKGR